MRVVLLAAAAVCLVAAAPPSDKGTNSNERAYTLTLMCTAVASKSGTDADKQRTLDAARKMAEAQGYGDDRLSRDMITMASVIGERFRTDPGAADRNRDTCRKLRLMG